MGWRQEFERLHALVSIALRQLVFRRVQFLLAVGGVCVAVMSVVLLTGVGYGAVTQSGDAINWFDRDIWATAGPVGVSSTSHRISNPLTDTHQRSQAITSHESVTTAQSVGFQSVYVSSDGETFDPIVAVGVGGNAATLRVASRFTRNDTHYANGTYEGPMTNRIVVDSATAAQYNLSVGDSLYIGSTVVEARSNEFQIVGITDKLSGFLGTQTIGMHLSELQEVSGTTGSDPGSFIAIRLEDTARPESVVEELNRRHPGLEFRTARDQTRAIIRSQQSVAAGGIGIAVVALLVGGGIAGNTLGLVVMSQSTQFAVLCGVGVSPQTLRRIVMCQGILVGGIGGVTGLGVVSISVAWLNQIISFVTGFEGLIQTPWWILGGGFVLAVLTGIGAGIVAVWRVTPVSQSEFI